jgi:hypothetical protein
VVSAIELARGVDGVIGDPTGTREVLDNFAAADGDPGGRFTSVSLTGPGLSSSLGFLFGDGFGGGVSNGFDWSTFSVGGGTDERCRDEGVNAFEKDGFERLDVKIGLRAIDLG